MSKPKSTKKYKTKETKRKAEAWKHIHLEECKGESKKKPKKRRRSTEKRKGGGK